MRFYWDRRDGKRTEGYARLSTERWSLRAEWNLWTHFCGIKLERTYEGAWAFMIAFPPIAIWLTISLGRFRDGPERELSLRIFDKAVWWKLWVDGNSFGGKSRWREGSWHPLDTILGRVKYSWKDLETRQIAIPMPEGEYPATAIHKRCTWKRPRWFARTRDFVDVDIGARGGIPHQGKGENSWDCGIDGLCGYSTEGDSFEAAIIDGVARALRYRARYDGSARAKYPAPAAEVAR